MSASIAPSPTGLAPTALDEAIVRNAEATLETRRVQFTPDLMPSDILGSEILDETADRRRSFRFVKGPIFAQLLMADEINRASPRTQSALLQAMQEHHVSVGGERHDLPKPFHVLATQNPLEQEGTYPLPEAQLDRLLLEIDVGYPAFTDKLLWGPGPRASQALMLAVRAQALIEGRVAPSVADVVALADPVLKHRMALTFAARADGETIASVIQRLTARLNG